MRWGLENVSYTVTKDWLGKKAWSLRNNHFFTLLFTFLFRCSWKFDLVSRCYIPRWFWEGTCWTELWLKQTWLWFIFWSFFENRSSWACLLRSGLKFIFHWIGQFLILFRSLFKLFVDVFILWTIEKSEVLSAKSLTFVVKSSERSLM